MKKVAVEFKKNGKKYLFFDNNLKLNKDDAVIVDTERGQQLAYVTDIIEKEDNIEHSNVIKIANKNDIKQNQINVKDAKKALSKATEISEKINLDMKFIDAYYNISDYLSDSRISLNNNPEIVDKNKEYYNEDKICKEEQSIIIEMINKYLSAINNALEKKNMNTNKKEILKNICDNLNESVDNFEMSRLEEINADIFTLKYTQRGLGGIIIGDDGSSLVCGSMYPISHYIEEFKNEKNKVANDKIITEDEYHNLFETDDNDAFVRLIIPANEPTNDYPTELNLIGKLPQEFTTDEIIRMKKYSQKMYGKIVNDNNDELNQKIQSFAKQHGYQKAVYLNDWNGYKCYEPVYDETQPSYTGLPIIILVDDQNNIRMSTSDEAFQQIRDTENN